MNNILSIDYADPKYLDPMEEIYAIRREISEECGHDIHRLFESMREAQRKEEAAGFKYIRLPIARMALAMT